MIENMATHQLSINPAAAMVGSGTVDVRQATELLAGHALRIKYVGSDGKVTERLVSDITVKRTRDGALVFHGWDVGKEAVRMFRVDRVVNLQFVLGYGSHRKVEEKAA